MLIDGALPVAALSPIAGPAPPSPPAVPAASMRTASGSTASSPGADPSALCSSDAPLLSASSASPPVSPSRPLASVAMAPAVCASYRRYKCAQEAPSGADPAVLSTVHPREAPRSSRRLPNSSRLSLRVSSRNLAVSSTTRALGASSAFTRSSATKCAACDATYRSEYRPACLGLRRISGHSPDRRRSLKAGRLANLLATTLALAASRAASRAESFGSGSLLAAAAPSVQLRSSKRLPSNASVMGSSILGICGLPRMSLAQSELPATEEPYAKSATSDGFRQNGAPVSSDVSQDSTL
mmetsp:Transcript_36719/g.117991  ORF Transcript_36719/g.117991 Transcript_36719/m.117991 type:complete len:297 (-) Transcript_36719:927-1817(-)